MEVVGGCGQVERENVQCHVRSEEETECGQHERDRAERSSLAVHVRQLVVPNQFAVYGANPQVDESAQDEDCDVETVLPVPTKITYGSDGGHS